MGGGKVPLIVPHDLAYPASVGAVTQIRRPVKRRTAPHIGLVPVPTPYAPSEMHSLGTYVVRDDGVRRYRLIGRVEILDVRREPIGAATDQDAKAEGFESLDDMIEDWLARTGRTFLDPAQRGQVVTFALMETRMLHRHSERGYTDIPQQAFPGTAAEPPKEWVEAESKAAQERWSISRDIARAAATRQRKYQQLAVAQKTGDRQRIRNLEADISRLAERLNRAA